MQCDAENSNNCLPEVTRIRRGGRLPAQFATAQESAQRISVVYVLKAGSFCKVGHTGNLLSRLTNIRMCCPLEIKLVFELRVSASQAPLIEAEAHRILKEHHQRGEWFKVGPGSAINAVAAAKFLLLPTPKGDAEAQLAALLPRRRGPYKVKRRRSQTLKIGLKYSGESAQESAQRRLKGAPT